MNAHTWYNRPIATGWHEALPFRRHFFLHDLPPTVFPTGGHIYRVEYKLTFTGGAVGWAVFRGEALAVLSG